MRRYLIVLLLVLTGGADAQLVYVKCCERTQPNPCQFVGCLEASGPWRRYFESQAFLTCKKPEDQINSSCIFGFKDTPYSFSLMAHMCWSDALPDQSNSECQVWADYARVGYVCWGWVNTDPCLILFDYDDDDDVDLRDYAYYQRYFGG